VDTDTRKRIAKNAFDIARQAQVVVLRSTAADSGTQMSHLEAVATKSLDD
jgi:hypothetical protein